MNIVRSRDLADRTDAQRRFETVLAEAAEGLGLITAPCATVGDEFQALAPALPEALTLILRIQLLLPEDLDLRFGVGRGRTDLVGGSGPRALQDGSAWWLAREAIDRAHALQDGSSAYVRTRYRADDGDEALVNAFLRTEVHIDVAAAFSTHPLLPTELALDGLHEDVIGKQLIAQTVNRAWPETKQQADRLPAQ